ncbi:Glutamine cyclotransferase [Polaribacter sp. KT25b]|uniref:glutaminyl-peptide cyclotransferase n=1 Tax=Polaribacter sp. KT25b TaxID=1855336 RepID=UPI00087DF3FE|nr:glutaminyl-peptide cyclotransferase [Polaribacter sp. KT25b]SDR74532.1 Glutamine cyclotransferase [Polaribacter sp. KT25b]
MKKLAVLISFLTFLLVTSCNDDYKFTLDVVKKTTLNSSITITLKEKNDKPVDNVQFFVDGVEISADGNSVTINTSDFGVGKHAVSTLAFFPGKTKKTNNSFEVLADKAPAIYTFKIINSFPHDTKAYTQGLEYHNGFLYETTGQRGESSLRKVEISTGKVLQKINLDKQYFGEGMTILNNKIYWLTWQAKKGFVYDLATFKQEKEFAFNKSKEGWGLTNNGTELIKSDGTNKIWFLNPTTFKEKHAIQVYTNKYALDNLNELELIDGKIYANKYQQNAIVIIDVKTGAVLGVANLSDLKTEMEKTQTLVPEDEVLNGIAFDKENNRLFVTGKHWGKLFEIELIKK